jgi:hypothetical protein
MRGSRGSRRGGLVLLAGLVVLLASFQPAEGHARRAPRLPPVAPAAVEAPVPEPVAATASTRPEPAALTAAPSASPAPWLAIAAAGLALAGVIARRSPRAATLGLAVVLTVFAAESTLHSVHHIADPRGAAHCQVLSVAQHVHGDAPATEVTADAPADLGPLPIALSDSLLADPTLRPGQERAPPARSV